MTEMVQRLLPNSISHDVKVQAAAQGVDAALGEAHDLTKGLLIYPNVDGVSEDILDHLAAHFHVDGYGLAESLEHKRFLVQRFFDLHRYKGTVHGIRLICNHILRRDLLLYAPPSISFLGSSLTEKEREEYESVHPEIRIYPWRHSGTKKTFFVGDCLGDPAEDFGVFPYKTDAIIRIGDYVELWDPLKKTFIKINTIQYDRETVERMARDEVLVRKPGKAYGIFPGKFLIGHLVDHEAEKRFFTLVINRPYTTEIERRTNLAVKPGLKPMRAYYREERVPGTAGRTVFLSNRYKDEYPDKGGATLPFFPTKSDAAFRIRKVLRLFDPERAVQFAQNRGARLFLGAFRLGKCKPHHGELAVDLQGKRAKGAIFLGGYLTGFPVVSDARTRIAFVRRALCWGKRASDKITLQTHNRYCVRVNHTLKVGEFKIGQYQLEVL